MSQYLKKDEEEGFTLIELLVVVLILGILMAIAIPTFLSLTGGAKTNAAEADLTTASQDEAVYFTTNGSFDAATGANGIGAASASTHNQAAMTTQDSGINWIAALVPTSAGTKTVSIDVLSNTSGATAQVVLGTLATDGNMYWVQDTGGTLLYTWTKTIAVQPSSTDFAVGNTSWKAMLAAQVTPMTA